MKIIHHLLLSFIGVIALYTVSGHAGSSSWSKYRYYNPVLNSIPVPNAFRPEGIVRGVGSTAYVGSLANGSIYQVDLETGEGSLLVERDDTMTVGLAYDSRTNYLFAAGGFDGTVNVYDAADGELKATFQLTEDEDRFINDGIVTDEAAFFTNSRTREFYRIPLSDIGRLPEQEDIETIEMDDGFEFVEDSFNANGIEVTPDGQNLIIVNRLIGKLFRVNPYNGQSVEINLGADNVDFGDGLLVIGSRLFVLQNTINQIAEIVLDRDADRGRVVNIIENDLFRVPTTMTLYDGDIYAINARFDVPADEVDETTDYDVVRVPLRSGYSR